jgi:drug/metabolite transporter (DMT)-like permease
VGNLPDTRLLLAVVAAVVFGASAYAAIGDAIGSYSPGPLALLRMLVALATFAVYAAFTGVRLAEVRDILAAVLAGLLAFALYNVALNYGQLSAGAGVASLIIASIPLFTALLAVGFLGEHLGARGWSGIAIGFFGVAMITVGGEQGFGVNAGTLLVLLAAVSGSIYFSFQKPYLEKYGSVAFTAYAVWAGTVLLVPFFPALLGEIRARRDHLFGGLPGCVSDRGRLHDRRLRLLPPARLEGRHPGIRVPARGHSHRVPLVG